MQPADGRLLAISGRGGRRQRHRACAVGLRDPAGLAVCRCRAPMAELDSSANPSFAPSLRAGRRRSAGPGRQAGQRIRAARGSGSQKRSAHRRREPPSPRRPKGAAPPRRENSASPGRTKPPRRKRPARSCSGRRGRSGCRRRRRSWPCPTTPATRRPDRPEHAGAADWPRLAPLSNSLRRRQGSPLLASICRHALESLGMPRHEHQFQPRILWPSMAKRSSASCSSGSCVLPARKTMSSGAMPAKRGQPLGVGHCCRSVSAPSNLIEPVTCTACRPCARGPETARRIPPFCAAIRSSCRSVGGHQRPKPPIAAKAALAQPAVDHRHAGPAGPGRANQIRPQLQLRQHQQRGRMRRIARPHRPTEIQRAIKNRQLGKPRPGQGEAGLRWSSRRRTPNRATGGRSRPPAADQQIHFADADGVQPDAGFVGLPCGNQAQQFGPQPLAIFAGPQALPDKPGRDGREQNEIDASSRRAIAGLHSRGEMRRNLGVAEPAILH